MIGSLSVCWSALASIFSLQVSYQPSGGNLMVFTVCLCLPVCERGWTDVQNLEESLRASRNVNNEDWAVSQFVCVRHVKLT